jgi:cobalamin biosynthesis Mg chelatase CobN
VLAAMSADYRSRVPVQVALLDVAGRDAIYAAEDGRWSEAAAAVRELRSTYAQVSGHVTKAQRPLNDRFRQTLDALAGAVSKQDVTQARREATSLLDDVDLIEGTY